MDNKKRNLVVPGTRDRWLETLKVTWMVWWRFAVIALTANTIIPMVAGLVIAPMFAVTLVYARHLTVRTFPLLNLIFALAGDPRAYVLIKLVKEPADTAPTAPWTVMTNVLGSTLDRLTDALPQILSDGGVKAQLYGKEIRPGRKLGHVNVSGTDLEQVRAASLRAATALMAPQDGE